MQTLTRLINLQPLTDLVLEFSSIRYKTVQLMKPGHVFSCFERLPLVNVSIGLQWKTLKAGVIELFFNNYLGRRSQCKGS